MNVASIRGGEVAPRLTQRGEAGLWLLQVTLGESPQQKLDDIGNVSDFIKSDTGSRLGMLELLTAGDDSMDFCVDESISYFDDKGVLVTGTEDVLYVYHRNTAAGETFYTGFLRVALFAPTNPEEDSAHPGISDLLDSKELPPISLSSDHRLKERAGKSGEIDFPASLNVARRGLVLSLMLKARLPMTDDDAFSQYTPEAIRKFLNS